MRCVIIDDDPMIHTLLKKYAERVRDCEVIGTYFSAEEALKNIDLMDVDLIFLDIKMPGLSGFDLLKSIPKKVRPAVIIISANKDYAVEGFEYEVDDFLLKPIQFERFVMAIERVKANRQTQDREKKEVKSIFVKESSSKYSKIDIDEIYWVEALENYVCIYTPRRRWTVHSTMRAIDKQLPEHFVRIHRSYIVNLNKIEAIQDNMVVMNFKGERKEFPIARGYRDQVLNKIYILKNK